MKNILIALELWLEIGAAMLLPRTPPRYLPGEWLVYARTEEGLFIGDWAKVVSRERDGRYYVQAGWARIVRERELMSEAEFMRQAELLMDEHGSIFNGVPVEFRPPGDMPAQ